MPNVDWNGKLWGQDYKWPDAGEVWSVAWGGSEAQWFGSLYPRLHNLLPARRILEIAPGYGRWTKFLLAACDDYLGIDLAQACVTECSARFASVSHGRFIKNDGYSLQDAPDESFDLIFSFDSLVHVERDVLVSYIPQMLRKLAPGGLAFIHHSNLLALTGPGGELPGPHNHARATTVSAAVVADLVTTGGGVVLMQEVISWANSGLIDAMTTFGRLQDFPRYSSLYLANPRFMDEALMIREFQSHYGLLKKHPWNLQPDGVST